MPAVTPNGRSSRGKPVYQAAQADKAGQRVWQVSTANAMEDFGASSASNIW
jgi:hypothetical protein